MIFQREVKKAGAIQSKLSLGQHFFRDEQLKEKIVDLVLQEKPDILMEIGPGAGAFTERFIDKFKGKIILIEKDDHFYTNLSLKYRNNENIKVHHDDILAHDLTQHQLTSRSVIFGSLPYNISKEIIVKTLTNSEAKKHYYIIQYEVAQKLKDHRNGAFYTTANLLAHFKVTYKIPRSSFTPQPQVNSALLTVEKSEKHSHETLDISLFQSLAEKGFKAGNKMLQNSNIQLLNSVDDLQYILKKRPAELTLEEWILLYKNSQIK